MKTTIDYTKSAAPNFDAVQDIIEYLGWDKYDQLAPQMGKVTDVDTFIAYCSLAGIEGFPVRAWYDHLHGQGAFQKNFRL